MKRPAWIRWTLFAALLILGAAQLAAYAFFRMHSVDFMMRNHNAKALAYSRDHIPVLPATLRFGAGEADSQRLGDGWNLPEPSGVWSMDNDAWIEIVPGTPTGAVVLRLNVAVYGTEKLPRNHFDVFVNDTLAASVPSIESGSRHSIEVVVSRRLIESGNVHMKLHVAHCESPLREQTGTDPRRLGVWLESLDMLRADDVEPEI